MLPTYDLIQILNHLLLYFLTLLMRNAYVIIFHVLKIDRVHRYWFCKRFLVLIETVPVTRVNVTALVKTLENILQLDAHMSRSPTGVWHYWKKDR